MAFNKDDLVINMVLSGTMLDKATRDVIFSQTMIQEPSLEIGGEMVYATDNYGMNIAGFNRSKTATFSGSNSLFSLNLLANQVGAKKEIASAASKIQVPTRELIQVGDAATITLQNAPIAGTISVEILESGKSVVGNPIPYSASTKDGCFTVSEKTLTLPADVVEAGTYIGVFYKYESENAVQVVNSADAPTTAGEFWLEVLFADKCNQAIQYYGYVVFPSAVMDNNASVNMTTDGNHPFTINATVDYCSDNHELFRIVVPDAQAA